LYIRKWSTSYDFVGTEYNRPIAFCYTEDAWKKVNEWFITVAGADRKLLRDDEIGEKHEQNAGDRSADDEVPLPPALQAPSVMIECMSNDLCELMTVIIGPVQEPTFLTFKSSPYRIVQRAMNLIPFALKSKHSHGMVTGWI
jgi:hypothetical protein